MLSTPGGKPASRQISQSRYAVIGVSSLGLAIAVFPHGDGGRDFPAQQIERQVPRRNQADDAARLAQRVVEGDAIRDVRLVFGVQNRGSEKTEIARGARNIERCARAKSVCRYRPIRRARISRDRARSNRRCEEGSANVLAAGVRDQSGNAFSAAATASSTSRDIAIGNLRIGFACRRLDVVEIFARRRRHELATDEIRDLERLIVHGMFRFGCGYKLT